MGYTHYWKAGANREKWEQAFPKVLECAKQIVEAAKKQGTKVTGSDGKGQPILQESGIYLNGNPDHESFVLTPKLGRFEFCKTEMKPYDMVVTAILLCAAVLGGDSIRVSSDGEWDEWEEGRAMVNELFPDFELSEGLIDN